MALLARGLDGLKTAKEKVENMGRKAADYPVDVDDAKAVEDAAEKAELELGPKDVWANNSMNSVFSPIKKWRQKSTKG